MALFTLSNLLQPAPTRGRPHEDRSCRCVPCVDHDRAVVTGRWRPNPDVLRSGVLCEGHGRPIQKFGDCPECAEAVVNRDRMERVLRTGQISDGTEIRATDFRDKWLSALENVSAEEVDRAAERMRQWQGLEPPVELDDDEE